jgi:hypothetical protein
MPTPDGQPLNNFHRPDSVPPGGVYFYEIEAADGVAVRFESYKTVDDLVWQIQSYLDLNGLPPIEHLKAKVIEYMCDNMPSGFCREDSKNPRKFITLTQVKDFTNLIFKRATSFSPASFLASLPEAERRASVCSECPLNDRSRCTVCGGLLAFVRKLVGRRETSYDPVLGTCNLCGCLLRVKVHVSSEALKASTTKPPADQIPGFCWLNEVYDK